MQPEFHNKPGSSAHAWITDSAPESIERQHDRSRNRFSGTRLKKCARIGRPGGRQAAGGQAGGQKPCAPVMADGPTQSEAVRSSIPPHSAVGTKSSRALVADAVEQSFLGALKHCANGVIVFPILGHLSTRPGHASGFQRQNQQNFDLPGC